MFQSWIAVARAEPVISWPFAKAGITIVLASTPSVIAVARALRARGVSRSILFFATTRVTNSTFQQLAENLRPQYQRNFARTAANGGSHDAGAADVAGPDNAKFHDLLPFLTSAAASSAAAALPFDQRIISSSGNINKLTMNSSLKSLT